jgi:hypothetical protein
LAPDITARTTKGRRWVGCVSYSISQRRLFCADFIGAGEGLALSVFTGGEAWEGLNLARSSPWGYAVMRTEADLLPLPHLAHRLVCPQIVSTDLDV